MTVKAIYEGGVFKPKGPVSLPDKSEVEFEPRVLHSPSDDEAGLDRIYSIVSQSVASGETNVAERHNEHQP